jgi:hypothetical protein
LFSFTRVHVNINCCSYLDFFRLPQSSTFLPTMTTMKMFKCAAARTRSPRPPTARYRLLFPLLSFPIFVFQPFFILLQKQVEAGWEKPVSDTLPRVKRVDLGGEQDAFHETKDKDARYSRRTIGVI